MLKQFSMQIKQTVSTNPKGYLHVNLNSFTVLILPLKQQQFYL